MQHCKIAILQLKIKQKCFSLQLKKKKITVNFKMKLVCRDSSQQNLFGCQGLGMGELR